MPHTSRSYAIKAPGKDGVPGLYASTQVKQALYNLSHDPGKAYDVQQQYPEVVATIMKLAEEARQDLGDDLTNRTGKNRRNPTMW